MLFFHSWGLPDYTQNIFELLLLFFYKNLFIIPENHTINAQVKQVIARLQVQVS